MWGISPCCRRTDVRDITAWVMGAALEVVWLTWLLVGVALLAVIGLTAMLVGWTLEAARGWMPTVVDESRGDEMLEEWAREGEAWRMRERLGPDSTMAGALGEEAAWMPLVDEVRDETQGEAPRLNGGVSPKRSTCAPTRRTRTDS